MRFVFVALPIVLIAAGLGIVADRWEPTRSVIDRGLGYTPPPRSLPDDPGFTYAPALTVRKGQSIDAAALADYAIRQCLNLQEIDAATQQVWLDQYQDQTRDDTIAVPTAYPDLAAYPGLIKLELIRSPGGADRSHCGATRIAQNWFMTAAHCFEAEDENQARPVYAAMAVSPALDVRSGASTFVPIETALCHGAHGTSRYRYPNDVALFRLEDVSAFSEVAIARIEDQGLQLAMADFSNAYLSAWGRNGGSRYFQGGGVTVSEIGEAVLVSQRLGDRGPDIGDSGSPLYVDFGRGPIVVGVLSQVTRADVSDDDTAVYVRAKAIRAWADRTMAICEREGVYLCRPAD